MTNNISTSDNKRLAKNTILLYIRTLLVMVISLFTSRIILASLGIDDYGTYNVIGGFVSMFSLVGGTLINATQRFINFELGRKDGGDVNKIFNTALGIHLVLVVILILLFETVGLWFLNSQMNIPTDSMVAANVVYQCSIAAFLSNVLTMPYNAIIIAYERMKAFAYITLLDAVLKLGVCYLLFLSESNRLIIYSVMLMLISLMNNAIYIVYCKKRFKNDVAFHVITEKEAYIKQTSFAGYTFVASIASILSNQGVNVVLNIFCGVAVNAARGIAIQVQQAVLKFVNDFMTSLRPQITKTYASGEIDKSMDLVYRGAKFSYFLMLIFSLPIIFRTAEILTFWLKDFPVYSVIFVQLTLVYSLVTVLSTPVITVILATGEIKSNAFIIGGLRLLILPLSYIVLKLGFAPYSIYFVMIVIDFLSIFIRLWILSNISGIKIVGFIREVLVYITEVTLLSSIVCIGLDKIIGDGLWNLMVFSLASVLSSLLLIYCLGLTYSERIAIKNFVKHKFRLK